MTKLRAEKVEKIADSLPPLTVEGDPDADLLIVGFGGTYGHLHSAMDQLNAMGKKAALAHFRVINPLPKIQPKYYENTRPSWWPSKIWDSWQAISA